MNLPREIGQLSSLQTLYPCNIGNKDSGSGSGSGGREDGGCGIEVLEGLNLLTGYITINHLRHLRSGKEAERANLMEKKNLHRICLSWHTYNSDAREDEVNCEYNKDEEAVLEALQPHPNLKMLVIDKYFGVKLPRWMGDPSLLPNLVCLQLGDCPKCEQLVEFGKLPSLKDLRLINMNGIKFLGNEFYYNNNSSDGSGLLFPSLKVLLLSDMSCLEEWVDYIPPPTPTVVANYSCFPCLEELHIYRCPNLRITPTTRFPSLKKVNLEMINEKVAVPLITTNLHNSLQIVELKEITDLKFLPHSLLQGSNICDLKVTECLDFQGFLPDNDDEGLQQQSPSLQLLSLLVLPNLKFLPDIRSFTSLENLYICECKSLKPIPEHLTCLPSSIEHLKLVVIQNVKEVKDFEWQK